MKATTTKKNSVKRSLAGILATVALATAFVPTFAANGGFANNGITASAAYLSPKSENRDEIEAYFKSLDYDEEAVLNASVLSGDKTRDIIVRGANGSVQVLHQERVQDEDSFDTFSVMNSATNVIYPGSLLVADRYLLAGNPTPIDLNRNDIKISISNANSAKGSGVSTTVNPTNAADVYDGIKSLKDNFQAGTDFPAQISTRIEKVESSNQIKAKLHLSQKVWGELQVDAEALYKNETQAVMVDISQVFYTVTANKCKAADLFADDVTVEDVMEEIDDDNPAVMVSSVDYGRKIIACIQTNDTSFDLKAAVEGSGLGGKIEGKAEAEYNSKLSKCTVKVFVLGGSSKKGGEFFTMKIDELLKIAGETTGYDGYAMPINYSTRFAKSGRVATSNYLGDKWRTVTSKNLTAETPMSFSISKQCISVDGAPKNEVIDKGSADIYGRRIIGINADGSYIKSEMQLIKHLELDYETKDKFNLPADVILDSVKVVFDYEGPDKYVASNVTHVRLKNTEAQRTVYFSDLFRRNGHPMSDFEAIEINVLGGCHGNGGDIAGRVYAPVKQDKLFLNERTTLGFGYASIVSLDTIVSEPGMVG
jgi:thiol-activated cytolysin